MQSGASLRLARKDADANAREVIDLSARSSAGYFSTTFLDAQPTGLLVTLMFRDALENLLELAR
jgi:hypothetical protein